MRTKALAFTAGLVLGLFLFLRFRFLGPGASPLLPFGPVQLWYQAALLLGGIALAGMFPAAWLGGPLGLSVAPILFVWGNYGRFRRPDSETAGFMLILVLLTASAPLAGGAAYLIMSYVRIPRLSYFIILATTLAAGAVMPRVSGISRRYEAEARERRTTEAIADLLRNIYEAEIVYSEGRPDRAFTCEGYQLQGMSYFLWQTADYWRKGPPQIAESLGIRWYVTDTDNVGYHDGIFVILDCSRGPHRFRASAFGGSPPTRAFAIDETGKMTTSVRSNGQTGSPPGRSAIPPAAPPRAPKALHRAV